MLNPRHLTLDSSLLFWSLLIWINTSLFLPIFVVILLILRFSLKGVMFSLYKHLIRFLIIFLLLLILMFQQIIVVLCRKLSHHHHHHLLSRSCHCWQMASTTCAMHFDPGPFSSIDCQRLPRCHLSISFWVFLLVVFHLWVSTLMLFSPTWCSSFWLHVLPTVLSCT